MQTNRLFPLLIVLVAALAVGAAKKAIITFVAKVTTQGSPDFIPPAERIATFDNDGTRRA